MGELARPPKEREGLWSGCGQPGSRIVSGLETGSPGDRQLRKCRAWDDMVTTGREAG